MGSDQMLETDEMKRESRPHTTSQTITTSVEVVRSRTDEDEIFTSLPIGCGGKAMYHDWVWDKDTKIPTFAKAALSALLVSYRPGNDTYPSIKLVADRIGVSKSRAKTILRQCRWSGWIETRSRRTEQGDQASNIYTFLDGRGRPWIKKDPKSKP